jgi:hypothetical protein
MLTADQRKGHFDIRINFPIIGFGNNKSHAHGDDAEGWYQETIACNSPCCKKFGNCCILTGSRCIFRHLGCLRWYFQQLPAQKATPPEQEPTLLCAETVTERCAKTDNILRLIDYLGLVLGFMVLV